MHVHDLVVKRAIDRQWIHVTFLKLGGLYFAMVMSKLYNKYICVIIKQIVAAY